MINISWISKSVSPSVVSFHHIQLHYVSKTTTDDIPQIWKYSSQTFESTHINIWHKGSDILFLCMLTFDVSGHRMLYIGIKVITNFLDMIDRFWENQKQTNKKTCLRILGIWGQNNINCLCLTKVSTNVCLYELWATVLLLQPQVYGDSVFSYSS